MTQVTKQRVVLGMLCLTAASLFAVPMALDQIARVDSTIGAKATLAARYPLRQRTNNFFERSKASKARR